MQFYPSNQLLSYFQKQPSRGVLRKSALEIRCKFTGEHPWGSIISIELLCNFTKIALRHECSPVNLLHIFRTPFYKSTYGGMLLYFQPICHCFSFKAPSESKQISVKLKTFEEIYFLSTITLKVNPFWKTNFLCKNFISEKFPLLRNTYEIN